jgi:hypothetical protein
LPDQSANFANAASGISRVVVPTSEIPVVVVRRISISGREPSESGRIIRFLQGLPVAFTIRDSRFTVLQDNRSEFHGQDLESIRDSQTNADGNRHTHTDLPMLLAGGGGGTLTPGRFVRHGSKPATNLFLSLADRMGVRELERIGDSTGRLTNV